MDYYATHARVLLERPIALLGFAGARVGGVAHALTGVTGLPLVEIERLVEHVAGRSRAQLWLEHGPEALRRLERSQLERGLGQRPVGVTSLPEGMPLEEQSRALLRSEARSVYVRRPAEVLLAGIEARLAAAPGSIPEFLLGAPCHPHDLEEALAERDAEYRCADVVYDALDEHPARVADTLIDLLGWELSA